MANRDLLKEAIADAKSVKEAAIANAKAALEEAFTPYLKEKFTAKLAEMEAEDMDEAKEEMDENYSEKDMEENINLTDFPDMDDEGEHGNIAHKNVMEKEDMDEEMDLDELLAELDEEMGKDKEMEETLNEQEEAEEEESEEEEGEEEDEIDLEDMTEDELKDLIEDVIEDMVRAGELEAGEKFEAGEEEGEEEEMDMNFEEEDEEEMVAERAYYGKNKGDKLRKSTEKERKELVKEEEVNELYDLMMNPSDMEILISMLTGAVGIPAAALAATYAKEGLEGLKRLLKGKKTGMEEGKDEMDEMKKEIEELASTLSETKLLNAKLLYSNKIFRAKNLNETQKVKVLEAFDKATTVKDAKLIYETLTTVKETKTAVTESMRGMASKAVGVAPEKKPILEVNDQFARWQILAGIKKNN